MVTRDSGRHFLTLLGVVVVWWLLVGGAVVATLPAPAASAPGTAFALVAGRIVRIDWPDRPVLVIPVDRVAYDIHDRALRDRNDAAVENAFAVYEWIKTSHGSLVSIAAVDGDVVQVELLDGSHAGRRGWMTAVHLRQTP